MQGADKDGSGQLDQKEFINMLKSKVPKMQSMINSMKKHAQMMVEEIHDKNLREAFKILDPDGNGEIDADELKELTLKISDDMI